MSTLTTAERAAGRCPADWSYRLPTEAEWEYACRAGTTMRTYFGDLIDNFNPNLDEIMGAIINNSWLRVNVVDFGDGLLTSFPVGVRCDNPWLLFDMIGNVMEWCQDSWDGGANYPGGSTIDPLVTTGDYRIRRGGSFLARIPSARSATRNHRDTLPLPEYADSATGFRIVLSPVR